VQYRPLAITTTPDGKFTVQLNGEIEATGALTSEAGEYIPLQLSYRAADATP
jgi:hypothetical protein